MAVKYASLYSGNLSSTANTLVYTATSNTTILNSIVIHNFHTADLTVTLSIENSSGTAVYYLYALPVKQDETITLDISQVVSSGRKIYAWASVNAVVAMHLSGAKIT